MVKKKLLLVPLVLSSETVYSGSPSGVRSALSNYCVPYSDTYTGDGAKSSSGEWFYQKFGKAVCGSVFEANYNSAKSNPKCDCSTGSKSYTSDYTRVYSDLGKYLSYDTTSRRCEPTCPNRHKIKELSGCPTGTY